MANTQSSGTRIGFVIGDMSVGLQVDGVADAAKKFGSFLRRTVHSFAKTAEQRLAPKE